MSFISGLITGIFVTLIIIGVINFIACHMIRVNVFEVPEADYLPEECSQIINDIITQATINEHKNN